MYFGTANHPQCLSHQHRLICMTLIHLQLEAFSLIYVRLEFVISLTEMLAFQIQTTRFAYRFPPSVFATFSHYYSVVYALIFSIY